MIINVRLAMLLIIINYFFPHLVKSTGSSQQLLFLFLKLQLVLVLHFVFFDSLEPISCTCANNRPGANTGLSLGPWGVGVGGGQRSDRANPRAPRVPSAPRTKTHH